MKKPAVCISVLFSENQVWDREVRTLQSVCHTH